MSVDAHVSRAGLKMVTVAHTSTGARLDISINKFDLQIPQKKMEIFNLKTDFYVLHRNTEKKQKMIVDNVKKHEICTGNLLKKVTGLTFCQIIKFPNASRHNEAPLFPFTGPVVYDLYMINEDAPNGYQIEGFTKQSPYSFYMDTPNSKVSRRIAFDTVMKNKNKAQITFTAPWKNIKIEGTVVNMDEMKKLTGYLSLNDHTDYTLNAELSMKNTKGLLSFTPKFEITIPQKKMKYEGKIEVRPMKTLMIDMTAMGFIASEINLKVSGEIVPKEIGLTTQLRIGRKEYYIASRLGKLVSKSGFKYTPSLKITIPKGDLVEFTSEIIYESNKKMSFDFKLNKVLPKTVAMNAIITLNAGKTKTKHILKVLFKSPRGNFRIIGDVDNKKAGMTSRVIGSYNFGAKYSDRLTLSSKIRDLSVKKSVRYMGNIALASKKQVFLNFNLKGQLAKAINHLETKFDLHYGNPKIKTNNLKCECVLNRALKPFSHAYDYTMAIQHPGQKINYKMEGNHVQSAKWPLKKFENKVMVQMAPGKVVQTKLSYNNAKVKGLPTYESEITLSYPGRDMKITGKLTQVNKNRYENHFTVQWQKGQEVAVQSTYTKAGKDIHNIENTLRLPNKKEAKATAMLQGVPGAYKAKIQFSADEEVISRQRINYKAEGGVAYTFNAKQMSSGVIGEIMWAPNQKISAIINFDYMKRTFFSGKLAFSTPFEAMKTFDSQVKFTWANRKYTSTMYMSLNNQDELKQDFSFVYPDFQLSYDASALHSGKKSEIGLAMKYSDMSLNGNIQVSHDKTTIINVILKHNAQKMGGESEMGLDFDMIGSNGKMKITLKYDQQKGEVMSNGEGKLNLPLQQLRQIGASYNLKHNNVLSSIDMGYSSSLKNYRNGKMMIEMKRNLPKMLKTKIDLTLNGNPMFNMNVNYGRQKDNIDMKVDITEANGQKITVSGNINISGSRKTGNVEIKSRYINLSADGAFEYQGTRSVGGELKMTVDGKSVMIRANYKKEGSTYKVTGTLGLPDGRSLTMEGTLDLQNIAASLKTMTPDFPELTEVDMAFSFNGDTQMFSSKASLKVMPYFDTTHVEMKFTRKQLSIEIKTRFESMKQAKVTFEFVGDWVRSQEVTTIFQLNNEQMVYLDMNYNFNSISDFVVNMDALTSHRRYEEFQFYLGNKGPLSSMQSGLKMKLSNIIMLDAMFQSSRRSSKFSLLAQLKDFDVWKNTFELKGNLNAMTASIITSIAKKEVNRIDFSLKEYGRSISVKVNGPKAVNFDFNMDLDTEAITFNMASTFTLNGREKYEMSTSYEHLSRLQIKTSIPSYQDEVLIMFSGNLKAFNVNTKFSHNKLIYELVLSTNYRQITFQLITPFLNSTLSLDGDLDNAEGTFTIFYGNTKYELAFTNKNFFQDCSLTVTIPKHVLKVNGKMNIKKKATSGNFNIIYNKKSLSVSGTYKDLGRKKIIKADLNTPYFKDSLTAVFNGKPKKFNAQVKVIHNGETYELTLSLSTDNYVKNIHIEVTTPQTGNIMFGYDLEVELNNFNLTSQFSYRKNTYEMNVLRDIKTGEHRLTNVSHQINVNGHFNGDLKSFSFNANAVFNKEKYEVMASTKNYFREISGKLTTPQFGEQRLSMKINGELKDSNGFIEVKNNNEMYRSEFSLKNQELRLSLPKWLKKLQVKLNGNWKNFEFIVQVINYVGERFEISATNKNFQEMKARLAIPDLDDIDILVKTSDNLRNGETTMKIAFGENIFENEIKISFDGRQASFGIEPHYTILGRSGKAKLQIDLMFETQSYKYEFEADVEGTQVKSMASVKISPEISVLMTVNIPTFDASEMKLRIVSRGFQKSDMMLNLKSPWTGIVKIFYEHNGQMGKSFTTKGYIERDGIRLAGYSLDTDFSGDYSFDFTCDNGNSKNKIETKGDLKFQGVKTVATLSVNTPFRVFKEFFFAAQTKMMRDGQIKAELDVKLPNQQYSLNIDLSNSNFNVLLNLNMDKKNKDKQYQFQTSYKNTDQRADVSRSFNFKMILPQRTVSLDSRFENAQHSMVMTGDLMWDEAKGQKAGFELMVQKGEQKEAKLRIITPRRTVELFGKLKVDGNHYSTVGHIMMDDNNETQKVNIKADMMILSDRADIDLTVKFPNQKKGINLKTSVNLPKGDIIFSSTSEFSMDQDPKKSFKMSTKIMSETKGKREMYTVQMDAGHAHSGFATEVIGRVSSSPEKYNADVEMGYLTLERQQQKFAIRGEMHRFNREVNLKLEAPSKTIELDGSLSNGNRYMMSVLKKESGKENMEALFKLNPKSQRMNIIFNVDETNPNQLYRIDADIMKSKATFKAYRTNKQRKQSSDGRITVELKTNNLFQSHIKWNPNLLEELNVYGYQKLSMYGKELNSFGDSLSQVMSDEVSMKFALTKRSFSEDMVPISDYFTTEYRGLSEDVAKAMHLMNQMFKQDSFCVRSATEAISNLWDGIWFNFNEYLIDLKQEIEVFNRNMNNKMDEVKKQFDFYYGQYSMQLRNEINELFSYCQEQYEMLYESAMEMDFSLMKNYPETIKELIDRMRQNLYGEKTIVFLSEMYEAFNEKTVQAKEYMTSAIYSAHATLNRHIASARRYPIVGAIMDAVNKVYQQALWSYNYWDVKDNVFGLKNTLYKFGAKKIKEIKDIITDVGMNTLIFDHKRGEIVVEIRFGAAKYFYDHFMSSVEDVERAVMKLRNLMPSFNLNVWYIYYMMKPSSDFDDYIPPFKAEATLLVGQSITTFDGRHLNYKGTCSYLLTHDFVNGIFTVVANFHSDRKAKTLRSLTVTTAHREQLEIFPDNKVLFNRRVVKLPLQLTDATVTLQGNLIVLESKQGYKVMCDHNLQLYTVQLSGWYFNKVAGLFGNYNNEHRDDMTMSNGRYSTNLEQFAQSWSASRQCKSHRNVAPKM